MIDSRNPAVLRDIVIRRRNVLCSSADGETGVRQLHRSGDARSDIQTCLNEALDPAHGWQSESAVPACDITTQDCEILDTAGASACVPSVL